METEIELTEPRLNPRRGLLEGAARVAVGLGCALPVPPPGIELIQFGDAESLCRGNGGWSTPEWDNSEVPEYFTSPIFVNRNQLCYNISSQPVPGIQTIDLSACEADSGSISPVIRHLDSVISNLVMPATWRDEGVEEPTEDCKIYAQTILRRLFERHGLIPYKASVSKEGGLFVAFKSQSGTNTLRVEIDNELDAVAVVSDNKRILGSGLLEGDDEEESILDAFRRDMA